MKPVLIQAAIVLLVSASCHTSEKTDHTTSSFELDLAPPYDTINVTQNGLKQGK